MMSDEMHTLSPKEQLKLTLKHDDPTYRYYKSIFHLTDGMIAVIDGERIIDANKAFIDFFATISLDVFDPAFRLENYFLHIDKYGYVYEGYLNRHWYENVLSHEKEHYKVGISGVEKIFTFSISVTPLDSTHQVYVITLSDVTDMMSYKCVLEEGLKTSNYEKAHTQYVLDQYNQAIDISNLVARCDLNGTITYVNDSLCRTLHYQMEELVGENVAILFESDNDAMCKHISWENLKNGGVWKGVLKNVGKKGEPHYFATTIIPIKNQENEVIEILSIRHEITEMVKAKEEALLLLEAKTKFFDQVSHELRTPLNAILNFTDQALESYDDILDDELTRKTVKQYLERAYKNSENLLGLINSLLDIAKMKSGKTHFALQRHNVVLLAKEAYENCYSLSYGKTIDYRFKSEKSDIGVICDGLKFKQILTNLISNALKFTTEGFVEVRVDADDTSCTIAIADSGIGIPEEKLGLIFEPFEQVRDHGFGTGLGLSIVREYVHVMGLTIHVDSKEGEGSCFTITAKKV